MTSQPGLSLHLKLYLDPADVPKFFEHFKPVYDAVIAEPECRFFEVYQDAEDPGALCIVEDWAMTLQDFKEKQMTKEYYKAYFAATEPMFVKPREFKIYDRIGAPYFMVKDQ